MVRKAQKAYKRQKFLKRQEKFLLISEKEIFLP